jgi:hypothetical protein
LRFGIALTSRSVTSQGVDAGRAEREWSSWIFAAPDAAEALRPITSSTMDPKPNTDLEIDTHRYRLGFQWRTHHSLLHSALDSEARFCPAYLGMIGT